MPTTLWSANKNPLACQERSHKNRPHQEKSAPAPSRTEMGGPKRKIGLTENTEFQRKFGNPHKTESGREKGKIWNFHIFDFPTKTAVFHVFRVPERRAGARYVGRVQRQNSGGKYGNRPSRWRWCLTAQAGWIKLVVLLLGRLGMDWVCRAHVLLLVAHEPEEKLPPSAQDEVGNMELIAAMILSELPKGPFRTKNSTALDSVVFCYRRSFSLSVPFSCLFFLKKKHF